MSIKTSKRIALGVIAGLVFAPFAAIAPASAVAGATVMATPSSVNAFVGQTISIPMVLTSSNAATAATDAATFTPTVTGNGLTVLAADFSTAAVIANNTLSTSSTTGAISILAGGASGGAFNNTNIGAFRFTASSPGAYTLTITAGTLTGYTFAATTVTSRIFVSPAPSSTLQASVLTDGVNGSIYKVAADSPTIMVTRPTGSSAPLALEIVSSPDATEYPAGAVIRAGDLQPAAGDTYTTVNSNFATSFTAPAGGIDAQGLYQFKAFIDTNSNNLRDAGEESVDVSFRIVGGVDKATVTLDKSSIPAASATIIATVALVDANGFPTYDTPGTLTPEGLDSAAAAVAALTGDVVITVAAGAAAAGAAATLGTADRVGTSNLYRASIAWTYDAAVTAALGGSLRFTPSAGSSAAKNVAGSASIQNTAGATATALALASATGIYTGTAGAASYTTVIPANTTNASTVAVTADPAVTTFSFTLTGTAAKSYAVTTTPGSNTAGSRISAPTSVTTLADGKVTFTVTVTTPTVTSTTADSFTINAAGTTNNFSYSVTYAKPVALWTLTPATTPNVLEKSTNKVTAKLTDSYGRVLGNTAYTVAVSGRNVSASTGVTDASGNAEFTVTDSATTSYALVGGFPTDTVTFTNVGTVALPAVNGAVSFSYKATLATVGTVTLTVAAGPFTIDQVEVLPGAPAGASTVYTATVRTAAGASVGAGTLVTFAGGADDLFVDGVTSGVTNASGQATVTVYRQKAGFAAITATANGVSGSAGARQWQNDSGDTIADGTVAQGAHDGRNVALSAAQTITPGSAATVIATVTDRWGNPVSGVLVTWSTSGVGRAILGADFTVGTDTNGQAQFQVTSLANETGAMTVRAAISGGQTLDLAGRVAGTVVAGVTAGSTSATSPVTFAAAATPAVVAPSVAPSLTAERQGNRVLLFGSCMADEGDMIIYVKSPGKAWSEKAKTLECAAGEYDGDIRASKKTKFYRVKQEGTGLWSTSKLVRP